MKILLTGANGQLGKVLQATFSRHDLVALSRRRLDIVHLQAVQDALASYRPALVINAGAYNNVDAAESDPTPAYQKNAVGPRNLAVATAERKIPLLHFSTDYVFAGDHKRPYHEYDRPNPLSVYGASKLAGEEAVRSYNPHHYLVRTAWLYAAEGHNFPNTMLALARERPEVRVVSDQFGSPTFAPHLAQMLMTLCESEAYGTYHLAGRGGTSWYELTRALYRAFRISISVVPVATNEFPRPAPRPRYSVLTTLQDPRLVLPPWEEGVAAFAKAVHK